jgi:hypothetical protein
MAYFQTKKLNLCKFWNVLRWDILVYFMVIWSILRAFVYFVAIWYILRLFGIFLPIWYVVPRKIWQPCSKVRM